MDARLKREVSSGEPEPLGRRLRRLRLAAGYSQRAVAWRIRRPNSMVSRWESGTREPTALDLAALGKVLRVTVNDLLDGAIPTGPARRWSSRAYGWRIRLAFGAQLANARGLAGLSRLEVLLQTGIGGLRLAQIEAGADPGIAELQALRRLYGLDIDARISLANLDMRRFLSRVPPARLRLTSETTRTRLPMAGSPPPSPPARAGGRRTPNPLNDDWREWFWERLAA